MEKNDSPFTDNELELLRRSFSRIGEKHKRTGQYVGLIAAGKRAANTNVAKAILKDLKELLKLLKPRK